MFSGEYLALLTCKNTIFFWILQVFSFFCAIFLHISNNYCTFAAANPKSMKKHLLLALVFCASISLFAEEAAIDTAAVGVHPYQTTANLVRPNTGFSLMFHGGMNVFRGDYPTARFSNIGYPTVGLSFEYNFSPTWGLGIGYLFAMPQVKTKRETDYFTDVNGNGMAVSKGTIVHKGMMHRGQVYATFNLVNAWFPKSVSDVFGFSPFAGVGIAFYKNSISFHDAEDNVGDAAKYTQDGDNAHAHANYENVGYVALGATADFNVSRQIALGIRAQYSLFLNDYVDNRYLSKSNKNNDALLDLDIYLRWKINGKEKNHVRNVASFEVLDEKYYESHPEQSPRGRVDTLVIVHRDTIVMIHHDTVFALGQSEMAQVEQPAQQIEPIIIHDTLTRIERLDVVENELVIKSDTRVVYGQSLSQLARKHYNNTFCWVYLWLANRKVAPDPNLILVNEQILVPVLTEEQKTITKEEAKLIAAMHRGETAE